MKRGVAPDHVPRITMFTVLASLGIKLGGDIKHRRVSGVMQLRLKMLIENSRKNEQMLDLNVIENHKCTK